MKVAIAGFFLLCGLVGLAVMFKGKQAEVGRQAQQAQAAQETRPRDLQLLKRPAVRAACAKHPEWAMDICQTVDDQQVSIGMTAEQVRLSWGKPQRINATVSAQAGREQWVYSARQYLYLQDGVVRTVQTPRSIAE